MLTQTRGKPTQPAMKWGRGPTITYLIVGCLWFQILKLAKPISQKLIGGTVRSPRRPNNSAN